MGLENPKHLPAPGRFFCKLLQLTATSGWSGCSREESAGWWTHKRAHSFGQGGLVEREERKSPAWTGCWKRRSEREEEEGEEGEREGEEEEEEEKQGRKRRRKRWRRWWWWQ